jgi:protein tyrosine/serine phosphatase
LAGILDRIRGTTVKLDWPDCSNARDLGGLPTAGGGRIRAGALLRSDHHGRLTPAAVRSIRAGGVRRILDLRWSRECAADPSPFAGDPVYRHAPMLNETIDYVIPPFSYGPMLDHHKTRIGAAFGLLADAPRGGVVVQCHGGRDRTGVLVALALSVAGVDPEAVAEDYARSPARDALTMRNTLDHARDAYGGVAGYLLATGVTRPQVDAVRERLVG